MNLKRLAAHCNSDKIKKDIKRLKSPSQKKYVFRPQTFSSSPFLRKKIYFPSPNISSLSFSVFLLQGPKSQNSGNIKQNSQLLGLVITLHYLSCNEIEHNHGQDGWWSLTSISLKKLCQICQTNFSMWSMWFCFWDCTLPFTRGIFLFWDSLLFWKILQWYHLPFTLFCTLTPKTSANQLLLLKKIGI